MNAIRLSTVSNPFHLDGLIPIHIKTIIMELFILYFCTSQNFYKMVYFSP